MLPRGLNSRPSFTRHSRAHLPNARPFWRSAVLADAIYVPPGTLLPGRCPQLDAQCNVDERARQTWDELDS